MKRDRYRRFGSTAGLFLALAAVVIALHYVGIMAPVDNAVTRLIQPVQAQVYRLSAKSQFGNERHSDIEAMSEQDLREYTRELEQRIDNLTVENSQLRSLVEDAQLLQEQREFLEKRSYNSVTARVTSRSTEYLTQTVIVNKGKQDGVDTGYPVIIQNGVLIGIVSSVEDYSSEVLLMTSADALVSAEIQNEQHSPGVVRGEHNLSLKMEYIPQLDQISLHQTVTTSGKDSFIPKGLLIGDIQEIFTTRGTIFQEASLAPMFNPASITVISILLP